MGSSQKSQYSAPALEKGLDILEYLAEQRLARSQKDIGQSLGRSQSEIYRMLACLESRGYLLKEAGTGNYRLSLRLYQLAHRQKSTVLLRQAALLPMDALAEETGQSCHLSVQHGSDLIVLMERMPSQHVCLAVGEGSALPLSQAASGKVILSRMPAEAANEALNKDEHYNALSQRAKKSLLRELNSLRGQTSYIAKSEQTESVTNIVVPVGVVNTDTAAVIAVPFIPSADANKKQSNAYLKSVLVCAERVNENLGINP